MSKDGQFVSHDTRFTVDEQAMAAGSSRRRRRRRDANAADADSAGLTSVSYELTVGGKQRHLVVEPNDDLFAPGIVVERRRSRYGNVSDSTVYRLGGHCHFRGKVKGELQSSVALAACDGLVCAFYN